MSASRPFSGQSEYPVSVCQKFQDGLDLRLTTGFCRFFPNHSVVQLLNPTHQQKMLQQMQQAAQQVEDDYGLTQRIACKAIGLSKAFTAGAVIGGPSLASAFPSQAETTLARYLAGSGYSTDGSQVTDRSGRQGPPCTWTCFGCSGPHPYSEYKTGNHVVICPNRDNPGLREHTTRNLEKMQKNHKKKHVQNTKRKNLGTANFSDFDNAGQQRIQEHCLAASGEHEVSGNNSTMSSVTGPGSQAPLARPSRGCGRGNTIFTVDVSVLTASSPLKPPIPISIQSNLPHIPIKFG